MNHRTDAEYDARIASIDAILRSLRSIQASGPLVALAQSAVVSAPTAARIPDTKKKYRPELAAHSSGCSGFEAPQQRDSLPRPEHDNVCTMQLRQRSSLRRASSERRRSLAGISWEKDIEEVTTISPRVDEQDAFMALVQSPPPLRPSSASPFDVTATAASAAAASRAGVKLAMANSLRLRNTLEDDGGWGRGGGLV